MKRFMRKINMFVKRWSPLIGTVLALASLFWNYKLQNKVTLIDNNLMLQNAGIIVSGNKCTDCGTGVEFNN